MPSKKMILVTGILILVIGAATFIAGRMFNGEITPMNAVGPVRGGTEFTFSSSNNITPAVELPTTPPEVTGLYVKTKDHTMIIQAVSFDPGIGGILRDSVELNNAPKVEILMTGKTTIYGDTTQVSVSPAGGNAAIHQTVEETTLDDLAPPAMITVWGRRSGDRIVATVLLFSNSLNIQKP
jgi:hypothetical protein